MTHPQKITFGEMREMGVRGVVVYCADYKCSHSQAISADQWSDNVRLSAAFQHVHNTADYAAIVPPLDASNIRWQMRFNPLPLFVAQPK
jgi:hypothetical protein